MAIRVGFDLMSAAAVRDAIDTHGQRYLQRVFSECELADSTGRAGPDARRLAERFAAKEATLKALQVRDEGVSWRDMEIRRGPSGEFTVRLSGRAERLARQAGIVHLSLSLTHEQDCAAAVVTAETRNSADT